MTERKDLVRTLTNALMEIRLIKNKMKKNIELIMRYSSMTDRCEPMFSNVEEQRKKLRSLIQAQKDHVRRFLLLKRRVDLTNALIETEINGQIYSISDLNQMRIQMEKRGEREQSLDKVHGIMALLFRSYSAMCDKNGLEKIRVQGGGKLVRVYDEEEKEAGIADLEEFIEHVKSELDTKNTTTNLLAIPDQASAE